jgi:hypothetical protein
VSKNKEYDELVTCAYDIGLAHGLAGHSLSEMMLSCERAVGRVIPVDVWLDLFDGRESGLKERNANMNTVHVPIDWSDLPL